MNSIKINEHQYQTSDFERGGGGATPHGVFNNNIKANSGDVGKGSPDPAGALALPLRDFRDEILDEALLLPPAGPTTVNCGLRKFGVRWSLGCSARNLCRAPEWSDSVVADSVL